MDTPDRSPHPTASPGAAHASRPSEVPARDWKAVARRVWRGISEDRVLLVSGGVTFYMLLALFPALAAFMSLYGLIFDPATILQHAEAVTSVMPPAGADIVTAQLSTLASQQGGALTFGFILTFLIAFWSANGGVKALIEGLNVAYDCAETRSFLRLNLLAFALTLGAMLLMTLIVIALTVVPALIGFLNLGQLGEALLWLSRWPILLVAVGLALAVLYRYGPDRPKPQWRWVTPGSLFATLAFIVTSIGVTVYLENFANFDATYGALAAPIAFLFWLWLSVIVVLIGAEINGEVEKQTGVAGRGGAR